MDNDSGWIVDNSEVAIPGLVPGLHEKLDHGVEAQFQIAQSRPASYVRIAEAKCAGSS